MFPLRFEVGQFTLLFLVLTIFPYLSSGIFSLSYIKERKREFRTFLFLTFIINILILFSKDLLTFLFLFELLSIASFPLIIYERSREAIFASKIYLMFSILSGLCIMAGLMLFKEAPQFSSTAVSLATIGFLIKCGAYPFHVWLPKAHPVAPTPASAILSGCIIKIGFFGLIKLIPFLNSINSHLYGMILLAISIITMFYGVLQALFQENSKVMLAYHSVSQMGYIIMGFSLFTISNSYVALSGALFHALNHAYFKSALFLSVGSVFLEYQSVNMYKIKGFFHRNRFISILFLISVLGISGVPLFNGFISKTLLHEAILEEESRIFKFVEIIFLVVAAGTFISNFKMYYLISFREKPEHNTKKKANIYESISLLILSLLIILLGIFPLLYGYIIPKTFSVHLYKELYELTPFRQLFLNGINSFIIIAIAGVFGLIFGLKKNIFHKKIPLYLDPFSWWYAVYNFTILFFKKVISKAELLIIKTFTFVVDILGGFLLFDSKVEKKLGKLIPTKTPKRAHKVDSSIARYYNDVFSFFKFLFTVAGKGDRREAKNYSVFLEKIGKTLLIALILITIFLTIGFILLLQYL